LESQNKDNDTCGYFLNSLKGGSKWHHYRCLEVNELQAVDDLGHYAKFSGDLVERGCMMSGVMVHSVLFCISSQEK
jgi:hypothetical protein